METKQNKNYQFDFNWIVTGPGYTDIVTIHVEDDKMKNSSKTQNEIQNKEIATYYTLTGLFDYAMDQYNKYAYVILDYTFLI